MLSDTCSEQTIFKLIHCLVLHSTSSLGISFLHLWVYKLMCTVWVKIKYPRARKNIKNTFHNFEIIFHLWHKQICSFLSPVQMPLSLTVSFLRYDQIRKSTQNLSCTNFSYSSCTCTLKAWYVAIPTVTYNNKTKYLLLLVFIYDVDKHFCSQ